MSQRRRLLLAALLGCLAGVLITAGSFRLTRDPPGQPGIPPRDARLLTEVMDLIHEDYVDKTDDHMLMSNAIRGMVGELDPHSSFMNKDEFEDLKIATEGNYSGIGVEVTAEDGVLIVIAPLDGSPAARAGLRAEDLIVAVDGVAVRGVDDLLRLMTEERIGVPCELEVVRAGVERTVSLVPRELDVA